MSATYNSNQIRAGEQATSARAMDEDVLKQLYEYNTAFQDEEGPSTRKRKAERPENWGGSSLRIMLIFIYLLAFLCLLRFDEVLRIQWDWITPESYKGGMRLKLTLPFQKTHQYGGKYSPFSHCYF